MRSMTRRTPNAPSAVSGPIRMQSLVLFTGGMLVGATLSWLFGGPAHPTTPAMTYSTQPVHRSVASIASIASSGVEEEEIDVAEETDTLPHPSHPPPPLPGGGGGQPRAASVGTAVGLRSESAPVAPQLWSTAGVGQLRSRRHSSGSRSPSWVPQLCPKNCSGQGACNRDSAACVCNQGYGGEACSVT
jgi:hypothetical protein